MTDYHFEHAAPQTVLDDIKKLLDEHKRKLLLR